MASAALQNRGLLCQAQPTEFTLQGLRRGLAESFSLNELQTLCFELNIDYESIGGEGKEGKARELVLYCARTGRVAQLLVACQTARPNYSWPVPGVATQPPPATSAAPTITTILFLGADPTDATRLRLGEELRNIQERLQMAELRSHFRLEQVLAVRPVDLVQAMLITQPQLVHFAGHGLATGELCLENETGTIQPVSTEALAALFALVADQVQCVVLNACHSVPQAQAIGQHIPYVIGMSREIGDQAALAFTVGFYQALGAGKPIPAAYEFGRVQIQLQGIPEHLTPVLQQK